VDADVPPAAHLQLFTFSGDTGPAPWDPGADLPFADPGWVAAPRDQLDVIVRSAPARQLWIGGVMRGDGTASPSLRQMRVAYGRDTYLRHLPAIYARAEPQRDVLERLLALHGSLLGELESRIDDLPRLADPEAAPTNGFPSWLSWLAGWLDFPLNEAWADVQAREYLAEAFALYGRRGTVAGLRRYLQLYAGVNAIIEEPIRYTTVWSLGESSTLGFTTMLAPGPAQGAVIGTTAIVDQSHLAPADECGVVLFEDVAHRFCVRVLCAELTRPGALADARAVLDREKPAHTTYHLCVIEPRLLVGVQARVGIDAIVAAGAPLAYAGMRLHTGALGVRAEPCSIEET
jgi:phage tail-like protein